jgi:hypothetical protein
MSNELTIKQLREQREFETLFKNPKHARAMWAQNVINRYNKPAFKPIEIVDKDGNLTPQCQIEIAIWNQLKKELEEEGLVRLPTEGEMMEACQAYYSRHNSSSYVARRDSMGAKPVDETKNTHELNNPFADLTDEELEIMSKALKAHKEKKLLEASENESID